jgi:LPS-assembly lipoprotein
VQIANDNEPSAGTVTLTADYVLTRKADGEVVATGRRQVSASFDRARQEFATLRAERDAQDRAARELAELLRLALAHDLERAGVR